MAGRRFWKQFVFLENSRRNSFCKRNVDKTGMYDVIIGFSAPVWTEIHNLYVNGVNQGQLGFPETTSWDELNAGTVKLSAGDNVIAVESSWGWTNLDYLRIEEAVLPDVTAKDTKCSDPQATESTQRLMKFLSDTYGNYIISGQQEYYGTSREDEFNYIKDKTQVNCLLSKALTSAKRVLYITGTLRRQNALLTG